MAITCMSDTARVHIVEFILKFELYAILRGILLRLRDSSCAFVDSDDIFGTGVFSRENREYSASVPTSRRSISPFVCETALSMYGLANSHQTGCSSWNMPSHCRFRRYVAIDRSTVSVISAKLAWLSNISGAFVIVVSLLKNYCYLDW